MMTVGTSKSPELGASIIKGVPYLAQEYPWVSSVCSRTHTDGFRLRFGMKLPHTCFR